jgi:hypothetical protein
VATKAKVSTLVFASVDEDHLQMIMSIAEAHSLHCNTWIVHKPHLVKGANMYAQVANCEHLVSIYKNESDPTDRNPNFSALTMYHKLKVRNL